MQRERGWGLGRIAADLIGRGRGGLRLRLTLPGVLGRVIWKPSAASLRAIKGRSACSLPC
jgi:hypothetical protein